MNSILENTYLISAALGAMLSVALISSVAKPNRGNFFLGLIILFISVQLLFSWGSYSGYNNSPDAFPFWMLLSYYILPASVFLFVNCHFNGAAKLKRWYALLYLPAVIEIFIHVFFKLEIVDDPVHLMEYQLWIWFIDYIPLTCFLLSLGFFWFKYFQETRHKEFRGEQSTWASHINLLLVMTVLSLIGLLWLIFSFIGWENFSIIEFLLVFLLFVFSFKIFLDSQPIPILGKKHSTAPFTNYDDQEQLRQLEQLMSVKQLYLQPGLSLKALSQQLNLPSRYLSYLINRYHHKTYKEFVNQYRIDAFIAKAQSSEIKHKTLLAIALESGFNSKSTFNQAFKNYKGKSPSEYLS